jgi:hypothetical protein
MNTRDRDNRLTRNTAAGDAGLAFRTDHHDSAALLDELRRQNAA